jgi:hypothetical protein
VRYPVFLVKFLYLVSVTEVVCADASDDGIVTLFNGLRVTLFLRLERVVE